MPSTDGHSNHAPSGEAARAAPVRSLPSFRRFGVSEWANWAGTALPLTACAVVWGIGDSAPVQVAWLTLAHSVIGTLALAWTVLQLTVKWRSPRARNAIVTRPKRKLIAIYALLALQSLLAVAGSMLHGSRTTIFGVPVPSVLPLNQYAAVQVDRLHGPNALLLLALISLHIGDTLREVRRRSAID